MSAAHTARTLDLSRLQAFISICEEGSISGAARRLATAQSALTVAMQKLEAELGTKLLVRSVGGVTPTESGRVLLRRAYDLLGLADATVEEICNRGRLIEGEVSIGLASSTAAVLAVPLVERLSSSFPNIRIRIVEAFTGYLWQWLNEGALDFGIVFDQRSTQDVLCTPIGTEPIRLIGRPDRLPRQAVVPVSALADLPLVMPTGLHSTRRALQTHADRHGVRLNVRLQIDAGPSLLALVRTGRWLSVLAPCALVGEPSPATLTTRILQPDLSRSIELAERRAIRHGPAYRYTRQELHRTATALMSSGAWEATVTPEAGF